MHPGNIWRCQPATTFEIPWRWQTPLLQQLDEIEHQVTAEVIARLKLGPGIRAGKLQQANPAGSRRASFQIDGIQNRRQSLMASRFLRHDQRFNRTAVTIYSH